MTDAPSPPHRELTGERPRLASPAEQTAKLAALTQPAKRPWLRRAVALGAVIALGIAAIGVAATRARSPAAPPRPSLAPLSPAEVQGPWALGDSRHWHGTMTGDAASWSFVLVLRQTLSGQVAGYLSWTARRAPGARSGEQVRENVEGNWDAPTRSLELHGTASTNPIVLPVNAYRIVVAPDGTITGTAMDSSSQLVGQRVRPTD